MVCLKRHYEYWYTAVALQKLGPVLVPVTHMLTVNDMIYRMGCIEIKGIICTPTGGVAERMAKAAARKAPSRKLWTVREDRPGYMNLSTAVDNASDSLPRPENSVSDPMLLYFTSGTTGYPKGVIHDYSYPPAHTVTAKYWHRAQDGGLHFTVAEASWGKIYG